MPRPNVRPDLGVRDPGLRGLVDRHYGFGVRWKTRSKYAFAVRGPLPFAALVGNRLDSERDQQQHVESRAAGILGLATRRLRLPYARDRSLPSPARSGSRPTGPCSLSQRQRQADTARRGLQGIKASRASILTRDARNTEARPQPTSSRQGVARKNWAKGSWSMRQQSDNRQQTCRLHHAGAWRTTINERRRPIHACRM